MPLSSATTMPVRQQVSAESPKRQRWRGFAAPQAQWAAAAARGLCVRLSAQVAHPVCGQPHK
jgi:hypothetical protein